MEETKRIDEVDILKGIGIILMITGHIEFGSVYDKWIHSFHMPMFFIISGFLFHVKEHLMFYVLLIIIYTEQGIDSLVCRLGLLYIRTEDTSIKISNI